jgi:hypothetical protein
MKLCEVERSALSVGDKMPEFKLQSNNGNWTTSARLLQPKRGGDRSLLAIIMETARRFVRSLYVPCENSITTFMT